MGGTTKHLLCAKKCDAAELRIRERDYKLNRSHQVCRLRVMDRSSPDKGTRDKSPP